MIRAIAAIDTSGGLLPTDTKSPIKLADDKQYFAEQTTGHMVLMGYNTYLHDLNQKPLPNRQNLVVVRPGTNLSPGFKAIEDAQLFLADADQDLWIIGGAQLFADTLANVTELYLTELTGNFGFAKHFPDFRSQFNLKQKGNPKHEQGITFSFNVYERVSSKPRPVV